MEIAITLGLMTFTFWVGRKYEHSKNVNFYADLLDRLDTMEEILREPPEIETED